MVNIETDQTVSIVDPFSANNNASAGATNNNNNNNNNVNVGGASGMVGDNGSPTQGNYGSPSAIAGSAGYSFQGKPRSIQKNRQSQNEENR